jgi:hypothetical protein
MVVMNKKWNIPHRRHFGALLTASLLGHGKISLELLIFHRNIATIAAVRVGFEEVLVTLIENVKMGVGKGRILIELSINFSQCLSRCVRKCDKTKIAKSSLH